MNLQLHWLTGLALIAFSYGISAAEGESYDEDDPRLEISPEKSLGFIQSVYLIVDDQVDDGCWTNANQIRQASRLTLEQSGIAVYDEPVLVINPFIIEFVISGLGLRTTSGDCFGMFEIYTNARDTKKNGKLTFNNMTRNYSTASVFHSGVNFNGQAKQFVDTRLSEFAATAIAQRRDPIVRDVLEWKGRIEVKLWSEFLKR